ncbi:hypothetical protein Esti_001237 [Eimeria stiedai]
MKTFQVVALASAALVALSESHESKAESLAENITATATRVDCLDSFNKARTRAGLEPFTRSTEDIAETSTQESQQKVCALLIRQGYSKSDVEGLQGTIAAALQGKEPNCDAAVTYFNGAIKNFGTKAPVCQKDEDDPFYKDPRNVSLVALYNPQPNAALDCGFYACKLDATDKASSEVATHTYGLVCSSTPRALTVGSAPFTDEQLAKIREGIENSAYAAAPALLGLAAAAAGLALF